MRASGRKSRGAILLEALGALCILTTVLGSIMLLLGVASDVKRLALWRVRLDHQLNMQLEEMGSQIGPHPDCSLQLEDSRQCRILERTVRIRRSMRSAYWDAEGRQLQLLQLSVVAVPENDTNIYQESAFALFPCTSAAGQ